MHLLLAALTLSLAACSSDNESTTVNLHQDDDNTTATLDESYTYQLPVIFHVLYKDASNPSQRVSATRLAEILEHVNLLYRGNFYSTDIGTSQNINLQFKLATYDEHGNKLQTPGVEYVQWNGDYPIDHTDFMNNNSKGYAKYLWEPNDFINVMIYPFAPEDNTSEVTLGVSHLPFTLKDVNETSGLTTLEAKYTNISKRNLSFAYCVSINSYYIDYEVDRYTNASHNITSGTLNDAKFDINLTLAHELGHYLGLLHVFGEATDEEGNLMDECTETDHCQDTPTYNRKAYLRTLSSYLGSAQGNAVSFSKLAERAYCTGDIFTSTNIMDYAYTYGFELTPNQKERIRRVLYNSPLIPGPKQRLQQASNASTRAAKNDDLGIVDLPIRTAK